MHKAQPTNYRTAAPTRAQTVLLAHNISLVIPAGNLRLLLRLPGPLCLSFPKGICVCSRQLPHAHLALLPLTMIGHRRSELAVLKFPIHIILLVEDHRAAVGNDGSFADEGSIGLGL